MTYICDYDIGRKVPEALRILGKDVLTFRDHFPQDTQDDVWLPIVGQRGWFVITKDDRQRKKAAERAALMEHKIGCFTLVAHGGTVDVMLAMLLQHWAFMERCCTTEERPFIYALYRSQPPQRCLLPSATPHPPDPVE